MLYCLLDCTVSKERLEIRWSIRVERALMDFALISFRGCRGSNEQFFGQLRKSRDFLLLFAFTSRMIYYSKTGTEAWQVGRVSRAGIPYPQIYRREGWSASLGVAGAAFVIAIMKPPFLG